MMTLTNKPTHEQLEDLNYWNDKPRGVIHNGLAITPYYVVMVDGDPLILDSGYRTRPKEFTFDEARQMAALLDSDQHTIAIEVSSYIQQIRAPRTTDAPA